ncbi:nucleotidyltransferase family protein [Candidatus Sumerlaeota bacterium]|nr:nucleotidyltransferase family protein [Candidatus Sumerlaeota bacterium]
MKALILAAGEGTRLRPLTYEIPKPLIDVCGRPIVGYALEQLYQKVDELILVIGYKGEQIREYFGAEYKGVKITYKTQEKQLGTAHAVNCAREQLKDEEEFLLLMGDNIYAKNDVHRCLGDNLCVLVAEVKEPQKFGIVIPDAQGYLREIIEKPENPQSNLANTALYKLSGEIFDEIDKLKVSRYGEYDLPEAVVNLGKRKRIKCIKAEGEWIPVGYPEELERARRIVARNESAFV